MSSAEQKNAGEQVEPTSARPLQYTLGGLLALFIIVALLMGVIAVSRRHLESLESAGCTNQLRRLGIALHGYHSATGSFPPAQLIGPDGKPWHSWRHLVHPYADTRNINGFVVRPYISEEPWNSPGWRAKSANMTAPELVCPWHGSSTANTISYVAVVGPDTAWPGGESVRISDITDGPAHTILIVEIPDCSIYWMEPRDLDFAGLEKALQEHGGLRVVYADGRVGSIPASIPRDQLKALVTIAGGEEIDEQYSP